MINLEQLEQLVVFSEEGTLSKTAEVLLVAQPSLTKNMQRLEEDLGVTLFHRTKNRMNLTETGLYTVEKARELLADSQQFLDDIQRFELQHTVLFAGVCAPGIEFEIAGRTKNKHENHQEIKFEQKSHVDLEKGLFDNSFQFIVTDRPLIQGGIICESFFKEQLYLSVPPAHPFALKDKIKLEDLSNLTMLLRSKLGIWEELVQGLTKTKFIVQNDWNAFVDLIEASALPAFSTNITQQYEAKLNDRVHVPICNSEATITFYISVLKKNQVILAQFRIE